jgi:hypothetical protein
MSDSESLAKTSRATKLDSLAALGKGIFASSRPMTGLAALSGFLALPQTADADIVYSPLNVSVGNQPGDLSSYRLDLPGQNDLRFSPGGGIVYLVMGMGYPSSVAASRRLASFRVGPTSARHNQFLKLGEAGQKFTQIGTAATRYAVIALIDNSVRHSRSGNDSFSHKYAAFVYKDTDDSDKVKYGWVEMSFAVNGGDRTLTLEGFAYQNDGSQLPMGATAVPEPQETAMMTGAALALGAVALRAWRKRQPMRAA